MSLDSRKGLMMLAVAITVVVPQASYSQTGGNGGGSLHSRTAERRSSTFIVAFELSPRKGFSFTWPYESMRPAPYKSVLVVVEEMPWVRSVRGGGDRPIALAASKQLRINGRDLEPIRKRSAADKQASIERFLVPLDRGRLRFVLSIPAATTIDTLHSTARIKLYQTDQFAGRD
jgi:hypothetical protein